MTRTAAAAIVCLLFVACADAPPRGDPGSGSAAASLSAPAPVTSTSSAPSASETIGLGVPVDLPPLPVEPPALEAAPLATSASEAERTAAVLELLAGGEPATRLTIRATDAGQDFDHALRQKVAPLAKPPSVRMGATTVSAGLPPEVVQRIVRQNFGRFRLCYENGLRNNPNLVGRVLITFAIDAKGAVQSPKGGGDLPDSAVIACVTKAFYGLSFPAPEGDRVVNVTYPIAFSPGN